ncbi:GNAT family N-acetyltransferase [Cellulomonas sp. NPDC089187]|uniref:GNAT family N-acetyltransferase n=1 Tax=Cellulomonas sp. NPDC089187 TaxID=3154970 RepID=UPI0034464AFC
MSALQLRRWYAADADDVVAALEADPELIRQLGGLEPGGDIAAYIERFLQPAEGRLHYAVVLDGRVVGDIAITAIERRHDTGWVSYWLAPAARGRGAAAAGLRTVAELALADGVFRLELGHRMNNSGSCRVATAAGFLPEGIERAKLRYGAERFDVETHARLATDPTPEGDRLPIV